MVAGACPPQDENDDMVNVKKAIVELRVEAKMMFCISSALKLSIRKLPRYFEILLI